MIYIYISCVRFKDHALFTQEMNDSSYGLMASGRNVRFGAILMMDFGAPNSTNKAVFEAHHPVKHQEKSMIFPIKMVQCG